MAFYQDPDKPRHRPSLIEDLFKLPTKAGLHPLENQATATLAWLIDRSPVFAREFVEMFLGPGSAPDGTLGARTWATLPNPDGGALFPDLCIEAAGGRLQLLVEVKVASGFAQDVCGDGVTRSQEAHYRWAWTALAGSHPGVRAVGTLTRCGGATILDPGELRANDVTWSQVRDLIERLRAASAFGPETELVARSFLNAIKARIAIDPPNPAQLKAWLAAHAGLATKIASDLRDRTPGATLSKAGGKAFIGHRVHIPNVLGSELRLRVYASPAGTAQNLVGEPDSLIVGLERDAQGTLEPPASEIFAEVGFLNERDTAGDQMHRRAWPMNDALADPVATAEKIWDSLSDSDVGPWARNSGRPIPDPRDRSQRCQRFMERFMAEDLVPAIRPVEVPPLVSLEPLEHKQASGPFIDGSMVSTKSEDVGVAQGRSEEHGAGEQRTIPAGSVGEVLGTDPTTGMVNVLFSRGSVNLNLAIAAG